LQPAYRHTGPVRLRSQQLQAGGNGTRRTRQARSRCREGSAVVRWGRVRRPGIVQPASQRLQRHPKGIRRRTKGVVVCYQIYPQEIRSNPAFSSQKW